ncbi:MAG: tetratricopeptide repeat protein [Endomicrobiales bacterium]
MRMHTVLFAAAIALFAFSGCSQNSRAEKMHAQALREHAAVLKDCTGAGAEEFSAAVKAFKAIVDRYPAWSRSAELQFSVGSMYDARNDLENARNELTTLYVYFPQKSLLCSQAVFLIGLSYEKQGDWNKARKEFERLIERYPASPSGLIAPLRIAEYYRRTGQEEECGRACDRAVGIYRETIDDDPDGRAAFTAQSYLVNALGAQGKWKEAAAALEEIAAKHPSSVYAPLALYRSAMIAFRRLNGRDRAQALLERISREYPESSVSRDAKFSLGRLFIRSGDVGKAKEVYYGIMETYKGEPPVCAAARLSLAQGYETAGKGDEALRECEKVSALFPDTVEALEARLMIAGHYLKAGQGPETEAAFRAAVARARELIARQPGRAQEIDAYRLLGTACFMQEQWQAGIDALRALLKAYPGEPGAGDVLFTVGTVYLERLGESRKARYYYTRLIAEYPGHSLAGAARDRLARLAGENRAE